MEESDEENEAYHSADERLDEEDLALLAGVPREDENVEFGYENDEDEDDEVHVDIVQEPDDVEPDSDEG